MPLVVWLIAPCVKSLLMASTEVEIASSYLGSERTLMPRTVPSLIAEDMGLASAVLSSRYGYVIGDECRNLFLAGVSLSLGACLVIFVVAHAFAGRGGTLGMFTQGIP